MKKLLLAVGVLTSTMAFSQSHEKGTMQVNIGWQSTLGGCKIEETGTEKDPSGSESVSYSGTGTGAKSGFGARFQYGIADNMSIGGYIRTEKAVYIGTGDFLGLSTYVQGFGIGAEGHYYLVNKDKFNLYAAPQIGFSTGKSYFGYGGTNGDKYSTSGLNYAILFGINYYFTDMIGLAFDLGYGGAALKTKYDVDYGYGYSGSYETKIKNGGVTWATSLVLKFGGK